MADPHQGEACPATAQVVMVDEAMRSIGTSTFLLLSLHGSAALAGDDALMGLLAESVVTTASHTAQTGDTAPATAVTLSAEDLRKYGIRTVEEAIDFLAIGVSTSGGRSVGDTGDLGARGVLLTGDLRNHFLLLVDGHAMNEPYRGANNIDHRLGLPLEMVDHVEIIVGPGSVLYGSNAMLGVINVATKDAERLRGGHLIVDTTLLSRGRAAAMAGVPFRAFGSKGGLTLGLEYIRDVGTDPWLGPQHLGIDVYSQRPARTSRTGGDTGIWGGGPATRSDYADVPSAFIRAKIGDFDVEAHGRIARSGTPYETVDFDDPDNNVVSRGVAIDVKHRALITPALQLSTRVYGDSTDRVFTYILSRVETCPFSGVTTCRRVGSDAEKWAGAEIQASYDWLGDGTLGTLIGVDGRLRHVQTRTDFKDYATDEYLEPSTNVINERDGILGVYAQQTWVPNETFGFNVGARLDQTPKLDPVLSPRAAVLVHAWEGNTFRAIYSQAFRAPSLAERESTSATRARALPLNPETVRSVEASVTQTLGAHRLFFGVFRTWWTDLVESRTLTYEEALEASRQGRLGPVGPQYAFVEYQNASSVDNYGFSVAYEGSSFSRRLHYGLGFTDTYARKNDPVLGKQLLPAAPTWFGNARLAYDFGKDLPTLAVVTHVLSERIASRGTLGGFKPVPYAPASARVRFTGSGPVPAIHGLTYRATVDVVTAERGPYVVGPSQVASPTQPTAELDPLDPLRVMIGLQYDFLHD